MPERVVGIGDLVRDRLTGFEGVVIGYTTWLTGCDNCVVKSRKLSDKGDPQESHTFDVTMLEVVEKNVVRPITVAEQAPPPTQTKRPGGPHEAVRQSNR